MADGYAFTALTNDNHPISIGGNGGGFSLFTLMDNQVVLSKGVTGDGYAHDFWLKVYWTGEATTDWEKPGNWSSRLVPSYTDEGVIPGGRPNYPILGIQTLIIGKDLGIEDCRCASLLIYQNASVTGGLGTILRNHGVLQVNGLLTWQYVTNNSIINFNNALIDIRNNGIVDISN